MILMNSQLISIIVPVYNVEEYVRKCILSILSQSYSHLELILIDDGSTDQSGAICDEFERKDKRITVKHLPNSGVSVARNQGVELAKGDYICFVDADDYLPVNSLEILWSYMTEHDLEIVIGGYDRICGNRKKSYLPVPKKCTQDEYINEVLSQSIPVSPWGRLYKRSLFGKPRFPIGIEKGEDFLMNIEIALEVKRVGYVNKVVYSYILRKNSAMHTCMSTIDYECKYIAYAERLLQTSPCPEKYEKSFTMFKINRMLTLILDGASRLDCDPQIKHLLVELESRSLTSKQKYILLGVKYMFVRMLIRSFFWLRKA